MPPRSPRRSRLANIQVRSAEAPPRFPMVEGGQWMKGLLTPVVTLVMLVSVLYGIENARAHTGAWIDSPYLIGPAPMIDGTYVPCEWMGAGATIVDLGAIPGNRVRAFLRVVNDGTYVYMAYDVIGDETPDTMDMAAVSFDSDHDGAAGGTEDEL